MDVDPATRQKLLERLERSVPSGRPGLGIALASVAGVGLVVGAVLPGGAADGRLRATDVIVGAGGEAVSDEASLARIVRAHAGRSLDLRVQRDGQATTTTVDVPSE